MAEAKGQFVPYYNANKDKGFDILYTAHADNSAKPMYPSLSMKKLHDKQMASYHKKLGGTFPFAADIGFKLKPFFVKGGLPLVLLIDTQTMKIEYLNIGHYAKQAKNAATALLNAK